MMEVVNAGWKKYSFIAFTGRVTGMGKDFVMYTIGQNLKPPRINKKNSLPAVRIETKTKSFNHIFLTCSDGSERSLSLTGFDVACREGHELTAICANKKGSQWAPYIVILNITTKQAFFSVKEIGRMFRPPLIFQLIFIPVFFIGGYFSAGYVAGIITAIIPGSFAGRIIAEWISKPGIKKFMTRFRQEAMNRKYL